MKIILLLSVMLYGVQGYAAQDAQELFSAMRKLEQPAIISLLQKETDIKFRDYKQRTLLMQAATFGHTDVVKYLLDRGADVNAVDRDGETPLKHAAWSKSPEVIRLLIKKGADIHAKNKLGTTPLWSAVISGRIDNVKLLLEHGADPNVPNQDGMSAIRFSRSRDEWAIVKILEEAGGRAF